MVTEKTLQNTLKYADHTGSHTLPVTIVKSRRRTGAILVDTKGHVELRIPLSTTEAEIREMLTAKSDWIIRKHNEMLQQYQEEAKNDSVLTDTQRALLEKRYRTAAKDIFAMRVQYYEQIMKIHHQKIVIRDQKTRWGSCSTSGTLSFNWRLILAPPEILDYVVVHELSHFKYMDHSPQFWASVEAILPDYKLRRDWLKEHGRELHI